MTTDSEHGFEAEYSSQVALLNKLCSDLLDRVHQAWRLGKDDMTLYALALQIASRSTSVLILDATQDMKRCADAYWRRNHLVDDDVLAHLDPAFRAEISDDLLAIGATEARLRDLEETRDL